MERNLRALPGLHQECLHSVSPPPRQTNPTKVSGSRKRDYIDISVLDVRHNILAILESWSRMVVERIGTTAPHRTVPHLARFLTLHLQWLIAQPSTVDFADEIESLVVELRRTIDPDPSVVRGVARKCVVEDCSGTISASPRSGGNTGSSSITCSSGHSWEVREWLSLRKLMERQRKGATA
ncbi:hypothetical protein [Streptomyces sp. KMM 9044]|uniref:hypothetical protein n=1 Tax=Streptomyces sp. KMM 9044 TaxID=2744474 RepID=UPI0021514CDD|nr:hypothetical protein [Streptomyces sp. KMM 9044]WAX82242.1 hypothetical protein HUV60_033385 [Streptomyces sp. KMM 9044]